MLLRYHTSRGAEIIAPARNRDASHSGAAAQP